MLLKSIIYFCYFKAVADKRSEVGRGVKSLRLFLFIQNNDLEIHLLLSIKIFHFAFQNSNLFKCSSSNEHWHICIIYNIYPLILTILSIYTQSLLPTTLDGSYNCGAGWFQTGQAVRYPLHDVRMTEKLKLFNLPTSSLAFGAFTSFVIPSDNRRHFFIFFLLITVYC